MYFKTILEYYSLYQIIVDKAKIQKYRNKNIEINIINFSNYYKRYVEKQISA